MKINEAGIQQVIRKVLLTGTSLSVLFVLIGSILFLYQHGQEPMHAEWMLAELPNMSSVKTWELAFSFSALGMIVLGILCLIATQLIRVAILAYFYCITKDYYFSLISLFILGILIFSASG